MAFSPSAFCQARMKLDPRALLALAGRLRTQLHAPSVAWLASVGTTARFPNTDDVMATFGAPPEGSSVPLARFSYLYDVPNGLVIEADLNPRQVGERVLAGEHLAATRANDLILYDRGYPAFWPGEFRPGALQDEG